eukprot:scaffold4044_cov399-Prasinococcus_capsulatus_cf.AAC.12
MRSEDRSLRLAKSAVASCCQLFFSKFRGQLAELARQTAIRDADLGIRMIQKACTQVLVFHKGAMDLASLDAIVCMVEALMSGLKPQHFQEHESVSVPSPVLDMDKAYICGD